MVYKLKPLELSLDFEDRDYELQVEFAKNGFFAARLDAEPSFELIGLAASTPVMGDLVEASKVIRVFLKIRISKAEDHVGEDANHRHKGCFACAVLSNE